MPYPQLLDRKAASRAYADMTLFTLTRDLHHVCEDHPVGASMSRGDINAQWWADWLAALEAAHQEVDADAPEPMRCAAELADDLSTLGLTPRPNNATDQLAADLSEDSHLRVAAQYVLVGAHLMGGQVMRKRIGDRLPTKHLQLGDRRALMEVWKPLRERVDLAEEARHVFRGLYAIMNEIQRLDLTGQNEQH